MMTPKTTTIFLLVKVEIEHSTKRALKLAIKDARWDVLERSTSSAGSEGWYTTKPLSAVLQEQQK